MSDKKRNRKASKSSYMREARKQKMIYDKFLKDIGNDEGYICEESD